MDFVQNFPFFSIIISMFSGIISSVLDGKKARNLCVVSIGAIACLSTATLVCTIRSGEAYTYMMGHFPAPWGNEIRVGILEGVLATTFSLILLLSVLSAYHRTASALFHDKHLTLRYVWLPCIVTTNWPCFVQSSSHGYCRSGQGHMPSVPLQSF